MGVDTMGTTLKKVVDGGEIPSTGTGVARMLGIAPKKDREQRIAEMKADHEQKQKDVVSTEEFYRAARTVLVCHEIDSFFKEKVAGHRQARDSFASVSQKTAERLANIWGETGTASQSHGSPEAAPIAEPVNEWE